MALTDLTLPIHSGMKSFPGEPGGYFLPFAVLDDGSDFAAQQLVLYSHLGTHMDAPAHFLPGGDTIDRIPLDRVVGDAMVAKALLPQGASELTIDDLRLPVELRPGSRVLICTGWDRHWGTDRYFDGFPDIGEALARSLVAAGVVLVGMDTPTPHATRPRQVHEILLEAGVAVVEGLTGLTAIVGTVGEFVCAPLPLVGVDGSPVRAFWRSKDGG